MCVCLSFSLVVCLFVTLPIPRYSPYCCAIQRSTDPSLCFRVCLFCVALNQYGCPLVFSGSRKDTNGDDTISRGIEGKKKRNWVTETEPIREPTSTNNQTNMSFHVCRGLCTSTMLSSLSVPVSFSFVVFGERQTETTRQREREEQQYNQSLHQHTNWSVRASHCLSTCNT